jgi:hypothetical protein
VGELVSWCATFPILSFKISRQTSQHSLNFIDIRIEHLMRGLVNQTQVASEQQMVFDFARGTACHLYESLEIGIGLSATALRQIGTD